MYTKDNSIYKTNKGKNFINYFYKEQFLCSSRSIGVPGEGLRIGNGSVHRNN